jgi:hypothetical protein
MDGEVTLALWNEFLEVFHTFIFNMSIKIWMFAIFKWLIIGAILTGAGTSFGQWTKLFYRVVINQKLSASAWIKTYMYHVLQAHEPQENSGIFFEFSRIFFPFSV